MARVIKLKYSAKCKECGADLPVGSRARYYGRGKIYGSDCHSRRSKFETDSQVIDAYREGRLSEGAINSHFDPTGVYAHDGTKIGSTCGCEDYPCCGH